MKRIRDERLLLQNLKNIRLAFIVQTLGLVAILVYQAVTEGIRQVVGNPLWLVLMLTMVVISVLQVGITFDVYDSTSMRKKIGPISLCLLYRSWLGLPLLCWHGFARTKLVQLKP